MKKSIITSASLLLLIASLFGQSPLVLTYTGGDIPTDMQSPWVGPSSCPGEMMVTVPEGNWITSVDVAYSMTAASGAWVSEQRSRLFSPVNGMGEAQYYAGSGAHGGTMQYERSGLTFANFLSGEVVFELHAGRTWGGTGCATIQNKVDNHTWTLTVHFAPIEDCAVPYDLSVANLTSTTATFDWMQFGETESWEIIYGEPGFDPETNGTLITGIEVNPFTLEGLVAQTSYDLYIMANCGEDGLSEWSDQIEFETLPGPLVGHYTINQNQPTEGINFNSFSDLAEAVNAAGMSGHVVVDVVEGSGPYFDRFLLDHIPNTSAENTLTINGNGETIKHRGASFQYSTTVQIRNSSHITLNQLIIKALGEQLPPPSLSEYAVALEVIGKSDHLTFYQCQMLASKQAVSTWFTPIIVRSLSDTDEAASHLTIEECLVSGGHHSLRMIGLPTAGLSVNNRIINNEIVDYHQSGIQLWDQHNLLIEGNRISRPERIHTEANWVYGIYFRGVSDGMQIIGNRIHGFSTVPIETAIGIYSLHGTRSSAGAPILIANNHISGYDHVTDMHYGIMLNTENGAGFVNIYHNTVLLDANNYSGNGLVRCLFHAGNFAVLDIRNNLFSYTTNSTGPKTNMYISNWSTTLTSNHNVFHRGSENTTQQNTVHFPGTTAFASLPAWQAAEGGAYDQQSSAADPLIIFSDEGEKIPSNPLISTLGTDLTHILPTDINGIPRSDTPSPGSHEFEAPACLRPSALLASGITQHSAMLGWTANGNEIAWQIEYGLAGFEPGTGTLIPNINENPYTVEDLVASTNYHFYVQALCGSRIESAWAGPYRFQTACDVFSTPLFEDFDDPFAVGLPACWEAFIINSNANSSVKKVPGTFNNVSYSQPYHIEMNDGWTSTPDLFLISPQIENGLSGINLRFMAKGGWADLTVEAGTWSADEEFSLVEAFALTTSYQEYIADFSAYDGPDTKIAFRHGPGASGGRRIYLDDIIIYQTEDLASCSGQVSNLGGEAVEGAKVILADQIVITDETGFYAFDDMLPGNYILRAEAGGYAVEELWLSAGAGDELTQDIVFQYANPNLPHNPTEAGVIEYPADVWTFNGSATDGHYIYKSLNNWTLYVYDSSDLENIAEVSNISLTMPELVFHYHHLYVFTWKSVRVYNTDDPANLQLISTFALEGIPIDLLFKEQTAWLLVRDGDMNSRLLEIDISNPASLNILATVNVVSGDRASAYLIPSRDLIYVHGLSQDQPANISIVDVSVAGEPVIVYSETHGVVNSRMAAGEDHFFLVQNVGAQGQILAYSTANPAIPVLLAEQDLPEQTVVSEMSNINGTLMIHTLHPQHGHRLISMVFDEDENKFYEGMGLKRPDFGMAAKYDFIVGGFGADEKQAGMKGSRDETPANGIVEYYLIPRGRTAGTSYSPPESPIFKIGKPPPDEDEDEDCEAELAVSGFRGPEYLCPSTIEDGNARMNVGTVAMCACEESGWSLGGFDLVASGTGHDAADISLVEVLGPANAFGTYPADDGVFSAIFYNPVTIAKGECVSFNVFYTFSFDPEEYAYDEVKSFKWQTGGVSASPLDCVGEIKGKARMDSLTFARVFTYREGLLTNVYAKIQEAIDNHGTIDEDELRVCPGTYEEAVEINKVLRISSFEGRDRTTIKGLNRQENIIAARKGFSLKGFTITSFAHGVNNGIFMGELGFGNFGPDWNTNTEIEDNRFVNLDNGITVESIFHISPGNIFINNNIFSNIEEVAINLPGFRNTHISENDFAGTSGRCTSIRAAVIDTAEIKNNTNMLSTSIDYMLSVETGSYLLFEGNHSSPNVFTLNSIYGIGKESATSHSRSVVVRNNQLFSLFMIRVPGAIVENNTIEEKFSFHYGKHIVFRENHVNEVYLLEVRSDGWNRSQISNNQMDNHRGLWIDDCEWIDIVDNSLTNSVYNGMYLTGSQNINVLKNYIAKNTLWPGILLVNSNRIIIRQNRVHENRTGIDARSLSSSAIINNSLLNNCTAFRNVYWGAAVSRNIELSNNVVRSSFCLFTGVDLSGAEGAVVSGNSIVDNFGAGFRLNNNANALFSNNNIFGNTHQVINNNPDTLLVANGNFWGTADGPQPGDVEGMVDVDSWLEGPVNLNIAFLEREVYARHGETDSLLVFIQNLTDANDEIAVMFNDTKGWLESESPIFTQFTDSTGFVFDLVFHIPEGELDSTLVTVTTTSALRNDWEAHGEVVIFSYDPHPALVVAEPDSVAMLQSDSLFVAARVYDQLDRRLDVPVTWSATAGEVDAPGVFRPGEHTGVLTITATATPPGGDDRDIPVEPVSGHATIRVYGDALPLAQIILTPDTTYLMPGQFGFFSYAAYCPEGFGVFLPDTVLLWTATGGEINTFGHYVAGEQTGTFEVTLTDIVSGVSGTAVVIIADPPQLPAPPQLLSPADASEGLAMPVAFSWTESEDTDFYILEVGLDEQLDDPVLFLGLQNIAYTYHQLEPHTTYYWRVFASGEAGVSSPSATWGFVTGEGEAPEVPEIFHVSGAVAAGADECFNALQTIFTGGGQGNFVVEPGGSATLIAGQNIIMLPGTHVQQGAWMHAYIAPDGPFCGDQEKHFLEAELLAEDDTGEPDAGRNIADKYGTVKDCTDKHGNDMDVTDQDGTKASSEPITTGPPDSTQKAFTSKLFSVYPNPTRDLFTIELQQCAEMELMRVEVYNMRGERIITEELPAGARHVFSLEEQPAGVYLVRVIAGDRMGIERVVKW